MNLSNRNFKFVYSGQSSLIIKFLCPNIDLDDD